MAVVVALLVAVSDHCARSGRGGVVMAVADIMARA